MALVSVVIPTYNRAPKVLRAVESVLRQTIPDYEIIVVDDGSTDGTAKALAPFAGKMNTIFHKTNKGVSAARNSGIRASQTPFISLLDSDDYWYPEKLAAQIAFFRSHPTAVACQTNEIWIRNGVRVNPQKKHLKPSGDIFEQSLKRCLVSPSAVMMKRSLLEEIGLFDESLPACEDYDLWLRVACRYPLELIDQDLVVKEGGHPDQLSARYRGMDRFRIRALRKLLKHGDLSEHQYQAAFKELSVKCKIYGGGCKKHGRMEEASYYLLLPEKIRRGEDSAPPDLDRKL
jgi:glycosyltransferase involved in cell wall biosynthesis